MGLGPFGTSAPLFLRNGELFGHAPILVLQMKNCLDGFNVPREHTAKLYIVGKRIMGSIGKFCSYE
jgi:hypothetical protein